MKTTNRYTYMLKKQKARKILVRTYREVYSYGFTSKQGKEIKDIVEARIIELKNAWNEHFK